MDILVQQCRQLCQVEFHQFTSRSIQSISAHAPSSLQQLTIAEMYKDKAYPNGKMTQDTMVDLACFPLLTHLMISGDTFGSVSSTLFTPTTFATHCPRLVSLGLYDDCCQCNNPDLILAFIKSHPHIKNLVLENSVCNNAVLDAITNYLPELVELNMVVNGDVTSLGVQRLIRKCVDLDWLDLHNCRTLGNDFWELFGKYQTQNGYLDVLIRWDLDEIRASR